MYFIICQLYLVIFVSIKLLLLCDSERVHTCKLQTCKGPLPPTPPYKFGTGCGMCESYECCGICESMNAVGCVSLWMLWDVWVYECCGMCEYMNVVWCVSLWMLWDVWVLWMLWDVWVLWMLWDLWVYECYGMCESNECCEMCESMNAVGSPGFRPRGARGHFLS